MAATISAGPIRAAEPREEAPAGVAQDLDLGGQLQAVEKTDTKLDSALADLAEQGGARLTAAAEESGLVMRDGAVQVQISVDPARIDAARQAVLNAGGAVTKAASDSTLLQAFVPPAALKALANDPAIQFVRRPTYLEPAGELQAGQLNTEGVAISNAAAWHNAGVRGAGVKVAVIDVGFEGYAALLGSDLPANVVAVNFADTGTVTDGGPHGTACAEIVYDMAPGVQLMLLRIATDLDVEQAIDFAIQQGAKIISASIGSNGTTAGDGNNSFTAKVTQANNAGITYFNAAGNERQKHWGGSNVDIDADGFIEFTPNDEINCVAIEVGTCPLLNPGFTFGAIVRWSDWAAPVDQDWELYMLRNDGSGWEIIAKSENTQDGSPGQEPVEFVQATSFGDGASYGFAIKAFDSTAPVYFDLFTFRGNLERVTFDRSLTDEAASPNVVAVAALDSVAPYPQEPYSSQGPALGPGGAQFGGISKPDIAAFANVNTRAYGTGETLRSPTLAAGKFNGTSAATPHVAGAAALVKGFYPSYTPTQVASFLTGRAIDIGTAGRDTLFGHGRLWLGAPPSTQPPPPARRTRFDFNGDARSDILWRNATTGQNSLWFMNGGTLAGNVGLPTVADRNWQVVATGDFNADKRADLVWRHAVTGNNSVWLMNGGTIASSAGLPRVADVNWRVAGTGDFNADGKSDLLWRNAATGGNVIWFMNGGSVAANTSLSSVPGTTWQVIGTGDFNADGRSDIFWRHTTLGNNAIWFMNGATVVSNQGLPRVADTSWRAMGTGDFNADGRSDILWRHANTGNNALWVMNGSSVSGSFNLSPVADTRWQIMRDGDFNADGRADILWRHAVTGNNAIWFMNGAALSANTGLPRVADASWRAVGTANVGAGASAGAFAVAEPEAVAAGGAMEPGAVGEPIAEEPAVEMEVLTDDIATPELVEETTSGVVAGPISATPSETTLLYLPLLGR